MTGDDLDGPKASKTATSRPPTLPIDRSTTPLRLVRIVTLGVVQALALLVMAWLLDGLTIDGFWRALGMVAVLAALNALVWPSVIRITLPLESPWRQMASTTSDQEDVRSDGLWGRCISSMISASEMGFFP